MALISHDLTVRIAEHVDMDSMVPLMLSSRTNYQLIRGYERSIVKAKLARMAHDPILNPPLGALLSSSTVPGKPGMGAADRRVLEPGSFAVTAELELRDRRINGLFNPESTTSLCGGRPLTETISRLPLFQNLPPNQMTRLIDGLKDACHVADRIADCAASVHLDQQQDKPTTTTHPKDKNHVPGQQLSAIDHETHLTRQQHIRSLPPIRIAFLTLLASLLGAEYAQQLRHAPHPDPFQWERVTAFKEAFLRHGTVLVAALLGPSGRGTEGECEGEAESNTEAATAGTCLSSSAQTGDGGGGGGGGGFAACQPDGPRARSGSATRYYTSQVTAVLMELLAYEGVHWGFLRPAGDEGEVRPVLDGLHMTMLQAFRVVEDEEGEEKSEDEEVDQLLGDAVGGDNEEDSSWLFNIDVVGGDAGNVEAGPSPLPEVKPGPTEALVLKWIAQR